MIAEQLKTLAPLRSGRTPYDRALLDEVEDKPRLSQCAVSGQRWRQACWGAYPRVRPPPRVESGKDGVRMPLDKTGRGFDSTQGEG